MRTAARLHTDYSPCMSTSHVIERRRYLRFPAMGKRLSAPGRVLRRLWSLVFLPYGLAVAWMKGVPGLGFHLRCVRLGLRALAASESRRAFLLIARPMDSFRYFEFEFAFGAARDAKVRRYLDVSSPRLLPFMIVEVTPDLIADMLNPQPDDLKETAATATAVGLRARCRLDGCLIEDTPFAEETFDLITSISVIEHIPEDTRAVVTMWRLLRPSGKLVITVPCAKESCEEYTNLDEYGLLSKDKEGFVYWQRYYDRSALAERIWSVTGEPTRMSIFGERQPGKYDDNVNRKRSDPAYPYWREPIMMGTEYRYFDSLDDLPGMGVVAMEFIKPPSVPKSRT
jgi:SAM-dependent methyltransferase